MRHLYPQILRGGLEQAFNSTEASDIDLLVSMEENRSLYDLIGLQQEIEQMFGRRTDVLTDKSINRYLQERILQEAMAL